MSSSQKIFEKIDRIKKQLSNLHDEVIATLTEYEKMLEKDIEIAGIPQIDLAELDQAPWFSYQTKQQAKPGTAAWTKNYVGWPGLQAPAVLVELSKALEKLEKEKPAGAPAVNLRLGDMEYSLSKPDEKGVRRFINRQPARKEKGAT